MKRMYCRVAEIMSGWGTGYRRIFFSAAALCCILLLTACGSGETDGKAENEGQDSQNTETETFYELQTEIKVIFSSLEDTGGLIGMQYWQDEPVQLRTTGLKKTEEGGKVVNISLYREDGSNELLFQDFPYDMTFGICFLDRDGSLYTMQEKTIIKWDSSGTKVFSTEAEYRVQEICQLSDGRIVLLEYDKMDFNSVVKLAELNPETGTISSLDHIILERLRYYHIGAGKEGLLLMNNTQGIYEVDMESGSWTEKISFLNSTYEIDVMSSEIVQDFRILENGDGEILWRKAERGFCEALKMVEIDKIPIVISGYSISPYSKYIADFNKKNETYVIIMDEPGEGISDEDFSRNLNIRIATGKGPDILCGGIAGEYAMALMDKGALEDLKPYMESSGIREEDYFPAAFNYWRDGDKIYGILMQIRTTGYLMDAEILGGKGEPDIETLTDVLLAWPEQGMYMLFFNAEMLLRSLLEGSEDMWGMINWEQGTCDFSGELFAKILEVAKRYQYDEMQDCPMIMEDSTFSSLLYFGSSALQEKKGRVIAGPIFDDGCHAKIEAGYHIFSIMANSQRKEGAWEFLRYLLGEEVQMKMAGGWMDIPVNRKAFEVYLETVLKGMEDTEEKGMVASTGSVFMKKGEFISVNNMEIRREEVTDEWIEEYIKALEDARPVPLRNEPILDIICEEAKDYFNGIKSASEVAEVVKNRVQLYINENY